MIGYSYTKIWTLPRLGESSGTSDTNWQEIWDLDVPPKIRMFLWRVCSNILPHAMELFRRHIASHPFCSRCTSDFESTAHVLMTCRGLRDIWTSPPFELDLVDEQASPWTLFQTMKQRLPREDFLVAMVIWWKAWDLLNKEVHGVEVAWQSDLVGWSRNFLHLYHESKILLPHEAMEVLPSIWKPPDPGFIKVNVDVAFPTNADFIRVAMVARDSRGVTIWWARSEVVGRPQPSEGEAMAVIFGVNQAIRQGWDKAIIEIDCLPVFRYLMRQSSSLVSFGAILDACFTLSCHFRSLLFSFVKRSGNPQAHTIATDSNSVFSEGAFFPAHLME